MLLQNSSNALLNKAYLRQSHNSMTLIANNETLSQTIWTLTGVVYVNALWGVVTTAIGSNHTAGYVELNDQSATPDITLATGITLSNLAAGTLIYKEGLTAAALQLKSAAAGFFEEPAAAGTTSFSPFIVGKKTGATTTIEYKYTTTNTPTSGVIRWTALWLPLSPDGDLS